ncbi:MAG TPA: hypothetical protein VNN07_17980 [Candidatus Tectomicrobia bacterium]|nr:hypothetical protein [Candidatus Tectomicrobia bacterium]
MTDADLVITGGRVLTINPQDHVAEAAGSRFGRYTPTGAAPTDPDR